MHKTLGDHRHEALRRAAQLASMAVRGRMGRMLPLAMAAAISFAQTAGSATGQRDERDRLFLAGRWHDLNGDGVDDVAMVEEKWLVSFQGRRLRGGETRLEIRSGATLELLTARPSPPRCIQGHPLVRVAWGERGDVAFLHEDPTGLHVHSEPALKLVATLPECAELLGTIPDEDGDGKVELVVNRYRFEDFDYRPAIVRSAELRVDSARFGGLPLPATSIGDVDADGRIDLAVKWPPLAQAVYVSGATGSVLGTLPRPVPWPDTEGLGVAQDVDGDGRGDFYVSRRKNPLEERDLDGESTLSLHGGATGRVLAEWKPGCTFLDPVDVPDRNSDGLWEVALVTIGVDGLFVLSGKDLSVLEHSPLPFGPDANASRMIAMPVAHGGVDVLMQMWPSATELARWSGADGKIHAIALP
jgi:hypothetical protein